MILMSKPICYFRSESSFATILSFVIIIVHTNFFFSCYFLSHYFFIIQAHFSQLELPISDYVTDLKSVLDQSIRIIQAMIDICANSGWLSSSITCMHLLQMVMQVLLISCIPYLLLVLNIGRILLRVSEIDFTDINTLVSKKQYIEEKKK